MRGEDLIEATDAQSSTHHGTGVTSILAGGQAPYHDRVGLAPGVEIIGHSYIVDQGTDQGGGFSFDDQLYAISDAVSSQAEMVLHEWTDIFMMPFDGSTNVEQVMDDAREKGVIHVNPVGNLSLSGKHTLRDVSAGEVAELGFYIDDGYSRGGQTYPYSIVYLSLFWRGEHLPNITLVGPDGTEVVIQDGIQQFGDAQMYSTFDETSRGTRHLRLFLWNENNVESLEDGDYALILEGFDADDEITGRIADRYSSWDRGITWHDEITDYGTAVYPSSADSAIGVAAYAGRHADFSSQPGELRDYSGRGPRLDGAPMVDVAAPDDPYAALTRTGEFGPQFTEPAAFMTFGGTSGAGPHVAASFALAMEAFPDWDADAIEDLLLDTTNTDDLIPDFGALPNRHWGEGKVDAFAALHDDPRPEDDVRPDTDLVVFADAGEGVLFDASGSSAPDGSTLQYRFDLEYDGMWDTDWSDEPQHVEEAGAFEPGVEYTARVDVRTSYGARSGALATFVGPDDVPHEPEDDENDKDDDGPTLRAVQDDGRCNATGGGPLPPSLLILFVFGAALLIRSRSRQKE